MLDENERIAILKLFERGAGSRAIARTMKVSRGAVREVLKQKAASPPALRRALVAEPMHDKIVELHEGCKGNLVRVFEELQKEGAGFSYQTLTRYCREHGIGAPRKLPAGHYDFAAGEEMQHDTSPHDVIIGGSKQRVQTASLVLCFSRMIFIQLYPRFTRFICKVFLTEALKYFGGSARRCMIDNTHVVVSSGTGKRMVPAPEMEAFGQRFGFEFAAHELGDANRSARVERPFHYIENNFLAGRKFADWKELNAQAREWLDKVNSKWRRHLHAKPVELFAAEKPRLVPLPLHVPDVYQLHQRVVDTDGYIRVDTHRYSVPYTLIGRQMEVREGKDFIEVFDGPRKVCSHEKVIDKPDGRTTLDAHRPKRGERPQDPRIDEVFLLKADSVIQQYAAALKKKHPDKEASLLRQLRRMVRDYPGAALREAVADALKFGLFDLSRVERMVLRNVGREFFNIGTDDEEEYEDK